MNWITDICRGESPVGRVFFGVSLIFGKGLDEIFNFTN